ncbi:MAG: SGNH/GDSL hydrolase family protein [Oscillospiraceae bacterium]|nr:SGNH/GDSL hydrolase family protein [Oscillospiraceae bacterium]
MKRYLCFAIVIVMLLSAMAGCGNAPAAEQTTEATTVPTQGVSAAAKEALDGKKVIFFGNSHTYYSRCVMEKGRSEYFTTRLNDQGIFAQLCTANGLNVEVTNYTFGNHQLKDFYSGSCAAKRGHDGFDHMADITDYDYDYLILQQGTSDDNNDLVGDVEKLIAPFKEANPDVKVVFLLHLRVFTNNYAWSAKVKELEQLGVTVVDWGGLLNDVLTGVKTVPGSTELYNQNSFIISQSDTDGYHPNMLTGYITALMTYCAITGEPAEGQPHLLEDGRLLTEFGIETYKGSYYTYDRDTNFDKVLLSDTEMLAWQQLIDRHLEEKGYRNY